MACPITLSQISQDCQSSMGGIKSVVLLSNYDKMLAYITPDSSAGYSKTSVDVDNLTAYGVPYSLKKNTGSMTSTATIDASTGANYWSTEVTLQFNRMEASKRTAIQAMLEGETGVFVKDANNEWYFLGVDEPVSVTAGTAQTGQNKSDGNFYSLTFTSESKELPAQMEPMACSYLDGLFI